MKNKIMIRTFRYIPTIVATILLAMTLLSVVAVPLAHAQTTPPQATTQQDSAGQTQGPECTGFQNFFGNIGSCFPRLIGSFVGTILMGGAGYLMSVAGLMFNYLIDVTIVQFGEFYTDQVASSINSIWSAFRDIANIAIIGGFVFVAISMILGINEFGSKKFVANLIIVAVLVNFSLFFTKVIIDASNLTASQFERAIDTNRDRSLDAEFSLNQLDQPSGVAGAFAQHMKLTSISDTYDLLDTVGRVNNSGVTAFLYGLMGATLFLVVAAVLLYGSFLLLSRAIVLVLLLAVSALAFASFAVPKLGTWWSRWITELIKNAFFAPVLMILLWATLIVAEALAGRSTGSLAGIVSEPTSILSLSALFNFFIILGLLFLSIKSAQHLSVAGANALPDWKKAFGLGALGAVGLTALGGGLLGRQTIGRGARLGQQKMLNRLANRAEREKLEKGQVGGLTKAAAGFARRLDVLTKADYNIANTAAAKNAAGIAGLGSAFESKVGGIIGSDKRRQGRYAETAERTAGALTEEDKAALKDTAIEASKQAQKIQGESREEFRTRAGEVSRARDSRAQTEKRHDREMASLRNELSAAKTQAERERASQTIAMKKSEHEAAIAAEDTRIRNARENLGAAKARFGEAAREAGRIKTLEKQEPGDAGHLAEDMAHSRFSNVLGRAMGSTKESDTFAQGVRKMVADKAKKKKVKKAAENAGLKEIFEDYMKENAPKPSE